MADDEDPPVPSVPLSPIEMRKMYPYYMTKPEKESPPLSVDSVTEALIESRGNVSYAARILGKPRPHLARYIERKPKIQLLLHQLRETLLDNAEHNFVTAVEQGHLESSKFVLQTFGKERGYFRPGVSASLKDTSGNKATFVIEV